jgi:two-component system sensor histidine kinase HydH
MESNVSPEPSPRPAPARRLGSTRLWLLVWLPIAVIGVVHYATPTHEVWVHNVLRRLYYLPILFAAFPLGVRGGLLAAAVVSISYAPHAFLHLGHMAHSDPAGPWDKGLEIVLYNVVGFVAGYLADLEYRRRLELQRSLEERARLQEQLVRAGRLSALGEVVAGIAHEIKNPLHSLKGTAEVVDPLIPAGVEERRMWEIHISELDRLQRVADRFVSFSNPQPPELGPLDLREVAQRLVELVGTDARKRGIELQVELPDDPVPVRGDRDQLAQVALNVALNAVRAIGERPGRIRVGLASPASGGFQQLIIENNGPPIPEADLDHLFDPFHSGHADGTGLGLAISSRIMEQHSGSIEASNAGLGVRFVLSLPPAAASDAQ